MTQSHTYMAFDNVHCFHKVHGLLRSSLIMGVHPGCCVCSIVATSLVAVETASCAILIKHYIQIVFSCLLS